MSAKIFTMKDSEMESLGAFAQPLLAKQVPEHPEILGPYYSLREARDKTGKRYKGQPSQ